MPSPNILKDYFSNAYYHIYNRGINKQDIFKHPDDYEKFIDHFKLCLTPVQKLIEEKNELIVKKGPTRRIEQLINAINKGLKYRTDKNISLLAYCLMPNHFHLLVFQKTKDAITILMKRLVTGYTGYFNHKYKRRGPLFESRYKACHFTIDPRIQTLLTCRYIERNPLAANIININKLHRYPYSSLQFYGNSRKMKPVKPIWLSTLRLKRIFSKIKQSPNGPIENQIAKKETYLEFVTGDLLFNTEDVRLVNMFE
ncbi:hypothetical protein B5M47_01220 [candidate division CPR3 bacterium 4484_211]|uniref:Transposase IS200-like domain-containing protein n=1 Tax=candidate division CPR3 bacterium 4484_211 TaxID=1968527 RepID=A0A1W9NYY4_UNCC3|nr:MAG: hypothetical protein B5M47_01220 [candidate division CPR3 bacterium 4484_211]